MNNNNINMAELMAMLSKMDKKDLANGIAKANEILKNGNNNDILNQINKNR